MTRAVSRRDFLGLIAGAAMVAASGCAGSGADKGSAAGSAAVAGDDIKGAKLTFVGDDAFAPYRYLETQSDGKQKVVGLDIAIADEMVSRLAFLTTLSRRTLPPRLHRCRAMTRPLPWR